MVRRGMLCVCFLIICEHFVGGAADDSCPAERQDAAQKIHDEAQLQKDLFCSYDSDIRPVTDHRKTVTVKVRLAIKYLSFDSLEETFTVHSWVAMSWKDEFLSWIPSNYGNIKETQTGSHKIWTPSMALFNADASMYQSDSFYTTCLLASDGSVTCVPHLAHSGICRTSLKRWPFDVQNCTLYFGSWMHSGEQVNYTFYKSTPVNRDEYVDGPGWKLIKVVNERLAGKYSCCPNSTYPILKYTFMLKREAAGPAAIVVVPCVVIVIITLTSIFLDVKENTRLILACFSLFGHFTFLSEIGFDIPKHSADTPLILLFIRDSMLVTLVVILATLFLMSLRRKAAPPPNWIVTVNRLVSSGPGRYVVFTEFDPSDTSEGKVLSEGISQESNTEGARSANEWISFANLLNSFIAIIAVLVYFILICTYIPNDD